MGKNTSIQWAHHTFNPWIGCQKVSPACDNCYAEAYGRRFGVAWGAHEERRRASQSTWRQPLLWSREAERTGIRYRVFCASLADVFDNKASPEWRRDLFRLIASTQNLDWLLLTKRIGNAAEMLQETAASFGFDWANSPWSNVWIGATVSNQTEADRDIPKLLAVPAAKRFLSVEPMLGAVDIYQSCALYRWEDPDGTVCCALPRYIDWVICGGETGAHSRPMHPDWVRGLRDQCRAAGVPLLLKQWGEWAPAEAINDDVGRKMAEVWIREDGSVIEGGEIDFFGGDTVLYRAGKKAAGRLLDGRIWNEVPA